MKRNASRTKKVLLLAAFCFGLASPVAGAEAPPSSKAKALFDTDERWVEVYWQLHYSNCGVNQLEFDVWGPNYERWMVSVDGNTFRLRDKAKIKPTIYTKTLTFQTPKNMYESELKSVVITPDGKFKDVKSGKTSHSISVFRYTDTSKFLINAEVTLSGWKQ